MNDYRERKYLSSIETSRYLGISVSDLHQLVKSNDISCKISGSGQKRFDLSDLRKFEIKVPKAAKKRIDKKDKVILKLNGTTHKIFTKNSMKMDGVSDNSVHLMITSPPYFDAKMYSNEPVKNDLGNIHDLDEWFEKIGEVWKETFRVLQPGRKAFINIMNLPIRVDGGYRTLNLVGRTIDLMERIGFIFKRDIIWHKTNGVRAHFGTYPYPGGILINNMHEFILEFDKPNSIKRSEKYKHLTQEQKDLSKIDKNFWLLIKNSDVWTMKPQNSSDSRKHVAPFPYDLPFRIIKAFS